MCGDSMKTRSARYLALASGLEDEAAVVRELFNAYAQGDVSSRDLADRLNAAGVRKPGSRSGGLGWVRDTVIDLLRNVAYIGKTYSVSRPKRQGDLIPATWSSTPKAASPCATTAAFVTSTSPPPAPQGPPLGRRRRRPRRHHRRRAPTRAEAGCRAPLLRHRRPLAGPQ